MERRLRRLPVVAADEVVAEVEKECLPGREEKPAMARGGTLGADDMRPTAAGAAPCDLSRLPF
jgi:hypothetical protein